MTVPLPIYNRNQGGILRAKMNVDQSRMQLADLERQALIDVEEAVAGIRGHAPGGRRNSDQVIPDAREIRDETYKLYDAGETEHQRLHQRPARIQRDGQAVSRHGDPISPQHARLNTVVGKKIMP